MSLRRLTALPCLPGLAALMMMIGCGSPDGPVAPSLELTAFAAPETATRPWVRWWWPGADVEAAELADELQALAEAGFGGVEIQPFDAGLDPDAPPEQIARRLAFDTPAYYDLLTGALEAARAHDLGVDLTFGSGWPAGGSRVRAGDSIETLMWNEWTFEGPTEAHIDRLAPKQCHFYEIADFVAEAFGEQLTRFLPERAELVAVLAAPITGGQRSGSMLVLDDTLALDPDGLVDLTDRVGPDGSLTFSVPAGRHQVVALFSAPSGDLPQLVAEPGEGFVLDHLHAGRVTEHLEHMLGARTGLVSFYGEPLRAVFTDSFELKVERHWAHDFIAQFAARRGYDLTPWLPATLMPGADNYIFEVGRVARAPEFALGSNDERIRYDFALTVSELFIERYFATQTAWLHARGLASRAQAYGINVDVIRAAAAVDIPEAEQLFAGGSALFLKAVAAGAHLFGRPVVSAEAMVFPLRDHMTIPLKIKAAADKAFTAGINQLVFHGFPYDHPGEYGQTGWSPFSCRYAGTNTFASHFGQASPFFDDLPALTAYAGRCQDLLRQGRPEADLAVLYPHLGFPTSLALEPGYEEPLLGGYLPGEPELRQVPFAELAALFGEPVSDPRVVWLLWLAPVLADLEARGYTWEWIDPTSLAETTTGQGRWRAGNLEYRAVLVPHVAALEPALAEHLATAARRAPLVVLGDPPDAQPGFLDCDAGDARVRAGMAKARSARRARFVEAPEDTADALAKLDVAPAVAWTGETSGVNQILRRLPSGGLLIFLANLDPEPRQVRLAVRAGCPDGAWLDAWTGRQYAPVGDPADLDVSLAAYESRFLVCGDGPKPDATDPGPWDRLPGPDEDGLDLISWDLHVEGEDVDGGALDLMDQPLADWREIEALRHCSSPGRYTTAFELPAAAEGRTLVLDLGQVAGVAEVSLDGEPVGRLLISPFRLDLTGLSPGDHELVVTVTPAWRNRLVGLGAAENPAYAQFAGKEDTLIPAGLLGPVRLSWR